MENIQPGCCLGGKCNRYLREDCGRKKRLVISPLFIQNDEIGELKQRLVLLVPELKISTVDYQKNIGL